MPLAWHSEHHSGDTIDRIDKGTSGLYKFSCETFETIYSFIKLIGSFGVLVYLFPFSGIIVLIMIILCACIIVRIDRVLIGYYRTVNRAENGVVEKVFDSISNVSTVITLRVESNVFASIIKKAEAFYPTFKKCNALNEIKWFLTSLCCTVMMATVMGLYFWQQIGASKTVMVANIFLLYRYLTQIQDLFYQFASKYSDIVQQRTKVANAEELSQDFTADEPSDHVLPPNWQELQIKNLDFTYTGNNEVVHLDDISFTIRRGEHIAFVGESGSGKTTCLRLMRDLYRPKRLSLSVDGIKIRDGFAGIARAVSLVPQDPEVFATTIQHNLTVDVVHDEASVNRFTDMACFTNVVAKLPNGLESSIKEKGVNLSGGEKQRLALARGLLACVDQDIILFDEPTSSLDAATEARVYKNIFAGMNGATIISSIHRLHLLERFDRVIVFDRGKIASMGTFEETKKCPVFQKLWQQYHAHSCFED